MGKSYPVHVKKDALHRVTKNGSSVSIVSRELGISESTLYRWLSGDNEQKKNSKEIFIIRKLEQRLQEVSDEREVLIKAFTIFAKEIC
ncbi:transposase [Pseudoalteromonas ruthenica]|uniref:Transposase n=1 Tax=Pseudoalteromonas ruthenica TaxID=151081 RepID=A0A0F4PND7_9GAMM|nr:transposase [Pseudoalteromonas ruthenica]KJY96669.1 hypothetical protein TW76_11450 [Pseudoalteromonas ruthenica]KJY98540.1 hypothetical protein TW72_12465 [Pseudoalteromonas ruthenica]TMO91262.1 hypothetical protein CWC13_15630 [Pseudoalteromonas ruthenica]TMO97949.1 hypothetical protein CWC07_12820 [Pseudoalteromonas ruthenica]TMP06842.1 hypothetical protein CWC09_10755 [Pseudoalteromonas ruthenica]